MCKHLSASVGVCFDDVPSVKANHMVQSSSMTKGESLEGEFIEGMPCNNITQDASKQVFVYILII